MDRTGGPRGAGDPVTICCVCKTAEARLPEGGVKFCLTCWHTRLRQLFLEEDRFHIQRVFRAHDAEKYLVYHDEHDAGATAIGSAVALHDRLADHLEVSAHLGDKIDWSLTVPFIYEQGVECEIQLLDVFLGVLEAELIPSWPTTSWTAEVVLCTGEPFWIDSRDREEVEDPES